jgi:hypothetical protein
MASRRRYVGLISGAGGVHAQAALLLPLVCWLLKYPIQGARLTGWTAGLYCTRG